MCLYLCAKQPAGLPGCTNTFLSEKHLKTEVFRCFIKAVMKLFLLDCEADDKGRVIIRGKDFHYLARVRRMKAGMTQEALSPSGKKLTLTVKEVGHDFLAAEAAVHGDWAHGDVSHVAVAHRATARVGAACKSAPCIVLLQAMAKPAKMDMIVRQAAEAGVDELVPFMSGRSSPNFGGTREERWRRIVKEARQQSGSAQGTVVVTIKKSLNDLFSYYNDKKALFERSAAFVLCEKPSENTANGKKASFHCGLSPRPELIFIACGPEGGFSDEENKLFEENGFVIVNMGLKKTVLRCETAAIWAVAAVSVIIGEEETWKLKE
jgi:16S rRNA (uracil1498-N3)-methyltransferase